MNAPIIPPSAAPVRNQTMRDCFLESLQTAMAQDDKIYFLSADFGAPALDKLRADFPRRFLNVGIAEQTLINVSTGLALEGFTVFAYGIAPFVTMRCFEQTRINLGILSELRPMNVNIIGVGAGYSYVVSGPTHQCLEDISVMRSLPNMQVFSPSDPQSAASLLGFCRTQTGPKYLRFDSQPLPAIYGQSMPDSATGFHVFGEGDIALIATGYMTHTALAAQKLLTERGLSVSVIDMFSLSRFSESALLRVLGGAAGVVTMEEGYQGRGGLDALIASFCARHELAAAQCPIGVEGSYRFALGQRAELHKGVGLDVDTIIAKTLALAERCGVRSTANRRGQIQAL